jgi:D-glycero-alpha-D-manno-heptose-7-phosphate kinase
LVETRNIGYKTRDILTSGDMEAFGQILTEQWKLKYHRQPSKLHQQIDEWIQIGISSGALGGKLVGAGGGGFLLFYAERKNELRNSMEKIGLTELDFRIDNEGTSVTVSQ